MGPKVPDGINSQTNLLVHVRSIELQGLFKELTPSLTLAEILAKVNEKTF